MGNLAQSGWRRIADLHHRDHRGERNPGTLSAPYASGAVAGQFDAWLGNGQESREDQDCAASLVVPEPEDALTVRPVGLAVNNIRNDSPELLKEVSPATMAPK